MRNFQLNAGIPLKIWLQLQHTLCVIPRRDFAVLNMKELYSDRRGETNMNKVVLLLYKFNSDCGYSMSSVVGSCEINRK